MSRPIQAVGHIYPYQLNSYVGGYGGGGGGGGGGSGYGYARR